MNVPPESPSWLAWLLTAIVIPSGAYLAKQFVEFLKLKDQTAREEALAFRTYLERKDIEAAQERREWIAELRAMREQEQSEMNILIKLNETTAELVQTARELRLGCQHK
jgi:hypothetical protein